MEPETTETDVLRPEYDFAALGPGVRGKHHAKARRHLRLVRLSDRLAEAFPDERSVQAALERHLADDPDRFHAAG